MSTLDRKGILDLQTTEHNAIQPVPLVELDCGDGTLYCVGLIPALWLGNTRLVYVFGKRSGSTAKIAYVLDQLPAEINVDTFCKLFATETHNLSLRDCFIGWLAMRAIWDLPVTKQGLDSWELRQFNKLTQDRLAEYILSKLRAGWTDQLAVLRDYVALEVAA